MRLVQPSVPTLVVLDAAVVTKDNVDQYLPTGFSPDPRRSRQQAPSGDHPTDRRPTEVRMAGGRPRPSGQTDRRERRTLGVGMVGYAFMGAAHAQALAQRPTVLRPAAHPRADRGRRP